MVKRLKRTSGDAATAPAPDELEASVAARQQARSIVQAENVLDGEERAAKNRIIAIMKSNPRILHRLLASAEQLVSRYGGAVPQASATLGTTKHGQARKIDRRRRRLDQFVHKDLLAILTRFEPMMLSKQNLQTHMVVRGEREATRALLCEAVECGCGFAPDDPFGSFETLQDAIDYLFSKYVQRGRPARLWSFPLDWAKHGPWAWKKKGGKSLEVTFRHTGEVQSWNMTVPDDFRVELAWSRERARFHHPELQQYIYLRDAFDINKGLVDTPEEEGDICEAPEKPRVRKKRANGSMMRTAGKRRRRRTSSKPEPLGANDSRDPDTNEDGLVADEEDDCNADDYPFEETNARVAHTRTRLRRTQSTRPLTGTLGPGARLTCRPALLTVASMACHQRRTLAIRLLRRFFWTRHHQCARRV